MKDPYSIFNELLESKDMPDADFRRYSEIYIEEMVSMLRKKNEEIKEQKDKLARINDIADSFLRNVKLDWGRKQLSFVDRLYFICYDSFNNN